jgi:hypothetical protein
MLRSILFTLAAFLLPVLSAAEYKAPALSNPDSWSMVIVPDLQFYIKKQRHHGIVDLMNAWIADNAEQLKIRQVLFVGDLVNYNDFGIVASYNDLICREQWEVFSKLMERLDGKVPYILCTGNHDYGVRWSENFRTYYNDYFPTDRNRLSRKQLIECFPNSYGERTMENAAFELTAPHPDNRKFLIISLQFAPTDKILEWAKKLADHPRFAHHTGIVLTHSYLKADGTRIVKENYGVNKSGGNAGEGIFQKLIRPAKNIRLVISGHVSGPESWGVGFSMTENHAGKKVAQMVFNTQFVGYKDNGNGGDGWLRLLEFLPDKKTVRARTFSPLFAISPSTRHLAWKKNARNEFTFTLE